MNGIQLYFRMVRQSLRSQLQYRGSFIMQSLGTMLSSLVEFLGVWALFDRFSALDGWTLGEAAVFFGMGNIAFALQEMFMREFDVFHRQVRTGSFDRILLRPRSTVLQMIGAEVQIMRVGRLIQGLVVLAIGLAMLPLEWTALHWTLLVLAILGGALLFSGMIVLQATSCFWTVESIEAWNIFTYGGVTLIQYPLNVYPRLLRYLFTFVMPLVAMNYWPCSYLLGRGYVPAWLSWVSPLIGLAFFALSLLVWNIGVRHYRSTGS